MDAPTCDVLNACSNVTPTAEWLKGYPLVFLTLIFRVGWAVANIMYVRASYKHEKYLGVPATGLMFTIPWQIMFDIVNKDLSVMNKILAGISLVACVMQMMQYVKYDIGANWSTIKNSDDKKDRTVAISKLIFKIELYVTMVGLMFSFVAGLKDTTGQYSASSISTYISCVFLWRVIMNPAESADRSCSLWPGVIRTIASLAGSIINYGQIDHNLYITVQYASITGTDLVFILSSAFLSIYWRQAERAQHLDIEDCDVPLICTAVVAETQQ